MNREHEHPKVREKYDHAEEMMRLWIKQAELEKGMSGGSQMFGAALQPYRAAPTSPRCHCL